MYERVCKRTCTNPLHQSPSLFPFFPHRLLIEMLVKLVRLLLAAKADEHHAHHLRSCLSSQHTHATYGLQVCATKVAEVGHTHVSRDGQAADGGGATFLCIAREQQA